MSRMENGMYIIQGEISLLVTAMRRNSRWLNSHSHQEDEHEPLITSFSQLRDMLCSITDLSDISPDEFLGPFLAVIRSENTTGPITGLALTSVNKFLSYGLISSSSEVAASATENIADAVTHARFVGTDPASDEVVLMKILHVLRTLMLSSTGSLLSNESVCEIMQSCFRICFEMRLSELLRKSAEHTLVDMVQLLFSRLPQFKEDAKLTTSLRKQLKMRTGGGADLRAGKSRKKPSSKGSKSARRSLAASEQTAEGHAEVGRISSDTNLSQSLDPVPNQNEIDHDGSQRQTPVPPDSLAIEPCNSDITASTILYDAISMSTTPVTYRGSIVDMGSELQETGELDSSTEPEIRVCAETGSQYIWIVNNPNSATDVEVCEVENTANDLNAAGIESSLAPDRQVGGAQPVTGCEESGSSMVASQLDVSTSEYVNTQGVRFTKHSGGMGYEGSSVSGPPVPYSLPCVRELLRFLVSLINPYDQHNTDVMIHMGLSLLTVSLESGADYIGSFRSLLSLVKDDMAKNLIFLLKSERLSLFSASIRVCFLLFESMRGYLKLQLEMYLTKLMEIIVSETNRVSYEQREIALESVVQLLRIPGLVTELYLNYDCDLYSSSLFEDLTKLLSKNAFPVAGLYSTHLLSLDALLAVIDSIEQHCHQRILNTTTLSSTTENVADREVAAVPPRPPASGFVIADKTRETHDWSQTSRNDLPDTAKTQDAQIASRIRPNRMKVSTSLPIEEELAAVKRKKKLYQQGTEQFNVKPVKGITFLQEHNLLSTPLDPKEVVVFLKENPKLDKKQIGEFLSNKQYPSVLEAFQKSFNFEETRIDEALRMYLEAFRLPGEAPVISLLLEHFADHWHKANGEPFANSDAAFTLSYAVIMLNVDQHNVNAKKQSVPMTVEGFKKNVSKVNGGKDFDQDMLEEVYNAIRNDEIVMPAEHVGLVRENYLWKVLLKRAATREGEFIHVPTGTYDRELFAIVWGPTVAALSFVFDKSNDEMIIQKAVSGFRKCAMISAHYGMSDVFDNLVISLCKFTTLLTNIDSVESIPVLFGNNAKAQLAARTVFGLTHRHSDILHDGWKNILDCMLQLYRAKLLAEILITVEDFLDPNGRISLIREETVSPQRSEPGVLSSFYSYFALTDTPVQRGPTAEEQEATQRAQNCIQECHVEQLIMESKFLRVDSLQELLKAMIYASRCPDNTESINSAQCEEDAAVFFLELLIKVVLQNRDRMGSYWQSVQDHLYNLIVNATESTFLVERAVVGLLRLTIRLLRRDEIASQVVGSLRMLLMMKPEVVHSLCRHIAYGLHDLLKTNAANIHTAYDWYTLFTLLEVVGAGTNPPPVMLCRSTVDVPHGSTDAGAQSDSEVSGLDKQVTTGDNASDRGYTSDSELYNAQSASASAHKTPSSHGSWMMLYRDDVDARPVTSSNSGVAVNQYSIVLCSNEECGAMMSHDMRSLIKCCETLAFLVRDAAHITPHNFTACVHAIRTFVEASVDGGIRTDRSSHRHSGAAGSKKSSHKHGKKHGNSIKVSRSSPGHLGSVADDERDPESYQTVSIQLLDLMHTLHTKAAHVYNTWAQEATATEDNSPVANCDKPSAVPADETEAGTSTLWTHCWCPLLQGIARFCCDARRGIRSQALTYLQRALLMHDLQTLTATEWENCFNKVLFPLLSKLLEQINPQDPSGIEETRMRGSTLLCKVFLQHLSPLLTLPTFTALWLTILEFMDKYMHADRSDLLSEAIPESLKNMLLVMHTAGILQQDSDSDESKLWKLTWDRIDSFLPSLREEVFKPHDSDRASRQEASHQHHETGAVPGTTSQEVHTQQPLPSPQSFPVTSHPVDVTSAAIASSSETCIDAAPSSTPSAEAGSPSRGASASDGSQSLKQYVLYPPLPVVSSDSIPLLLNPDILQSSAIPVISGQQTIGDRGSSPSRH